MLMMVKQRYVQKLTIHVNKAHDGNPVKQVAKPFLLASRSQSVIVTTLSCSVLVLSLKLGHLSGAFVYQVSYTAFRTHVPRIRIDVPCHYFKGMCIEYQYQHID